MKSKFIILIVMLSINLSAQEKAKTIILYTISPYFGPTLCEDEIQKKYGFVYSSAPYPEISHRKFRKQNRKGAKKVSNLHGKNWYEAYQNEVKECTETNKSK